jgi:hypothetical protein
MTRAPTPDAKTLTFLLALADEFNSDDDHVSIERMSEENQGYWQAPFAGACWSCRKARDQAIRSGRGLPGLTIPETHAISWWRPIQDSTEALAFLHQHEDCTCSPLALRIDTRQDADGNGSPQESTAPGDPSVA